MLIVFGIKVAVTVLGYLSSRCPQCGAYGAHEVTKQVRRLSLFFVPVLPLGAAKYVGTCPMCGWRTELSPEQARAATQQRGAPGPQDSPTWPPSPQDR